MYSKQENQKLKQEFWLEFAKQHPHKWILYNTKIKDFAFKFYVDNKKAQVLIDIEHRNNEIRWAYFEKMEALQNILEEEFVQNLIFFKDYTLENGKIISRIWVEINDVSFSNKIHWNTIFDFFNEK